MIECLRQYLILFKNYYPIVLVRQADNWNRLSWQDMSDSAADKTIGIGNLCLFRQCNPLVIYKM